MNFRGKVGSFISSDVDRLRTVVVQTPRRERRHVLPRFGFISSLGFSSILLGEEAERQHDNFKNILEKTGVRVLETHDLIDSSVHNLDKKGLLTKWVAENFPSLGKLSPKLSGTAAEDLVGATDKAFYQFNKQMVHSPLARPLLGMFFVRDLGVVVPEGVILTSFNNKRAPESRLARLIFSYSDQLSDVPVVFDAVKERVFIQGGDLIVYDDKTLFMGIDNLSSRKAAALVARKLGKTVLGVRLAPGGGFLAGAGGSLASLFLHLDTCFSLVDKKKSLVVPYFFEERFRKTNPLLAVMKGARLFEGLGAGGILKRLVFETNLRNIENELRGLGEVLEFVAGSGEQRETGMKLVDYLRERMGHKIIYVGGDPPGSFGNQVKHMVEVVVPEVYFQAANVVAISPGRVVGYRGNTSETQKALQKSGVDVETLEGYDLVRWNGGPHCMTLPIERGRA